MLIRRLEEKTTLLTQIVLLALVFFTPLSISLRSITLVAVVVLLLTLPEYKPYLSSLFSSLWGTAALALFSFIALACLWSPASFSMQWSTLEKYDKLLLLPVLALGFTESWMRRAAINTFLVAMLITCLISIAKSRGFLFSGDPGQVAYNYIVTGFMMALACYLALWSAWQSRGWVFWAYLLVAPLYTYQIFFINQGRTGYLIYCLLMVLLLVQQLSFKKLLLGLIALGSLLTLIYMQSITLQTRIGDLAQDIQHLQQANKNTSLGYRLQFHDYAKTLFLEHPLFGLGTGGYKYRFIQDNPVPSWGVVTTDPHSQYWMILAEQGSIGFILLLFFLASLLITSFRLQETRAIVWAVVLAFSVASLTDTVLCYSAIGYLLVLFSALSLGELIERLPNKPI